MASSKVNRRSHILERLMQRFTIHQRLLIMAASIYVPGIIMTVVVHVMKSDRVVTSTMQVEGAKCTALLVQFNYNIAVHRGLAARYTSGDHSPTLVKALDDHSAQIKEITQKLDKTQVSFITDDELSNRWLPIAKQSNDILENYKSYSPEKSFAEHTALIEKNLDLIQKISTVSKLSLDPNADTYYLSSLGIGSLPALSESFGRLRAEGSRILTQDRNNRNSTADIQTMISLQEDARVYLKMAENSFAIAIEYNPDDKAFLTHQRGEFDALQQQLMSAVNDIINDQSTLSAEQYFKITTDTINQSLTLSSSVVSLLVIKLEGYQTQEKRELIILYSMLAFAFIITTLIQLFAGRSITGILKISLADMKDLAEGDGDLTRPFDTSTNDEIGQLMGLLNTFIESLKQIVEKIDNSSNLLNSQSSSIKDMIKHYADAAQTQAAATEEASASAEELTASTEHISASILEEARLLKEIEKSVESFMQASNTVEKAITSLHELAALFAEQASTGKATVDNTAVAIQDVHERALSIDEIVDVINEISERTNLLALNAAIEAARAGDSGRGFAVVADEISKLAEQTSRNTRNIQDLVSATKQSVQNSVEKVQATAQILDTLLSHADQIKESASLVSEAQRSQKTGADVISTSVSEINRRSTEIVDATKQQRLASEEISKTAQSIAEGTISIANRSQGLNDSAERLAEVANSLKKEVSRFKY